MLFKGLIYDHNKIRQKQSNDLGTYYKWPIKIIMATSVNYDHKLWALIVFLIFILGACNVKIKSDN